MQGFCGQYGFRECMRKPTRGNYLLDLILTDLETQIILYTLPAISDHLCTAISFSLKITPRAEISRRGWHYSSGNWSRLRRLCRETDWTHLDNVSPSVGATWFQNTLLSYMRLCIPQKTIKKHGGSHPWVNGRCLDLLSRKISAIGTEAYEETCKACNDGFFDEYLKYVAKTLQELSAL